MLHVLTKCPFLPPKDSRNHTDIRLSQPRCFVCVCVHGSVYPSLQYSYKFKLRWFREKLRRFSCFEASQQFLYGTRWKYIPIFIIPYPMASDDFTQQLHIDIKHKRGERWVQDWLEPSLKEGRREPAQHSTTRSQLPIQSWRISLSIESKRGGKE